MRFLRVAFWFVFTAQALLMAALSAGAAVAAQFGRSNLEWDILTHFAPFWLAGAALSVLLALVLRGYFRAIIVAVGSVGVIAAGGLIAPEFLRDVGPQAPSHAPDQLKLVQFNLWHSNEELPAVAAWLQDIDADIAVVEEANPTVARALAPSDWRLAARGSDVMIFSRERPIGGGADAIARTPGPFARATFRDRHGEFSVIGVHYAWPTDIGDQQEQEARLAALIALSPRERTIVAGDFNSAPWSFSRRSWDAAFGLIRRERALPTWPARQYKRLRWMGIFPFLPIDHVYAGSDWATVKVERGPRIGSDHYPVVITLAPRAPR